MPTRLLRTLPWRPLVAVVLLLLLSPSAVLAQSTPTPRASSSATPAATTPRGEDTQLPAEVTRAAGEDAPAASTGGGGIVRTIVGLLIVIAVIYGVTWILKQVKASREGEATGGGLGTAASLPLGAGRALHLVRAGEEYLLLGVTDGGVQHLRSYTEDEARAAGFPIESDDDVDELRPLASSGKSPSTPATAIVERLRELTTRR